MVSKTFRSGGSCLYFVICLEGYGGFDRVIVFEFGLAFLSNNSSQLVTCLKNNRTLNLFAT